MSSAPPGLTAYLKQIPLFADLNDEECVDIMRTFATAKLAAQADLFRENDPGEAMFLLEKGALRVHKKTLQGADQEIARLGPGASVGEMSLLDGQPRSATVTATADATLYRIDRPAFTVLRANLRPAAFKVIRTLARSLCARLRELDQRVEEFWADPERSLTKIREQQKKAAAEIAARMAQPRAAPTARSLPGQAQPARMSTNFVPGGADDPARLRTFLADVPLLRGLSPKEIDVLATMVSAKSFAAGASVCKEGDPGDGFFVVASGSVEIVKDVKNAAPRPLATLGLGAIFGEVSLIDGKRRSATCRAASDAILLVGRRDDFEALFRANSPLAFRFVERIAADLSRRVREADEKFTSIFSRLAETSTELEARLAEVRQSLEGGAWPTDTKGLLDLVGFTGKLEGPKSL